MNNTNQPTLSIIVPVYNAEKYLWNCVESVLEQSFEDFELILINDGSTDKSGELCDEYAQKDKRIRVIHQTNKGVSAARNNGLNNINGKYVTFMDSDDKIDCDTYKYNIEFLLMHKDIDMIQFPTYFFYGSDRSYLKVIPSQIIEGGEKLMQYWWSDSILEGEMWNKIFRQEIFKDIRFPEGHIFEDCYLIADLVDKISKAYISEIGCYYYYYREGSYINVKFSLNMHIDLFNSYLRNYIKLFSFKGLRKYRVAAYMRAYRRLLMAQKEYPEFNIAPYALQIKNTIPNWYDLYLSEISFKEKIRFILLKKKNIAVTK